MYAHPYIAARIIARYQLELRQAALRHRSRPVPANNRFHTVTKPPRRAPRHWRWKYL